MQGRLHGKVARVTGAFGGIGSVTVRQFLSECAAVITNDLSGTSTKDLRALERDAEGSRVTHLADHANASDFIETLREEDWDRTLNACLGGRSSAPSTQFP